MCFFWISAQNPKKHMEIQNFQKFLGRPIVLEIFDFLEILDFFCFKFWMSMCFFWISAENPKISMFFLISDKNPKISMFFLDFC